MKKLITLLAFVSISVLARSETTNNFSTGVIDYGIIVRDIEKSVSFYESIGFEELTSFGVPSKITGDSGLTDYKELNVVMMSASGDDTDTKVKLMEPAKAAKVIPQVRAKVDRIILFGVSIFLRAALKLFLLRLWMIFGPYDRRVL